MIIVNILISLLVIILQILNLHTLTKTLRYKNTFMYFRLISNDYVFKTIKPYKIKLLKNLRLLLLATLIITLPFIVFNNSNIFLVLYLLILLVIPYLISKVYIEKCIKEFKTLNIDDSQQDHQATYFGLLFKDENKPLIEKYGYNRYLFNYATTKGKALIVGLVSALLIVFAVILVFVKPASSDATIVTTLSETSLTLKYDEKTTVINFNDLKSVTKSQEFPRIVSRVDGIQENGYIVGVFNLQGYNKATIYHKTKASEYLIIKVNNNYYFYSESDVKKVNSVYVELTKHLKAKKK